MNLAEGAVSFIDLVITSGGTATPGKQLEDGVYPVGIFHPIITTSTALLFEVSYDGVTFVNLFGSNGTAISVVVAPGAAGYTVLDPSLFAGVKWIKVKVANAQASDRTFKLAVRGI